MSVIDFIFQGTVCSELNFIQEFIDDVLEELEQVIESEEIMFDTRLILSELVFNGAIHGNKLRLSKSVALSVRIKHNKLIINVKDDGTGLDFKFEEYDPLDGGETGRGLVLVRGLSDEMVINQNAITVIKNLA